jgi:hypothetical protein
MLRKLLTTIEPVAMANELQLLILLTRLAFVPTSQAALMSGTKRLLRSLDLLDEAFNKTSGRHIHCTLFAKTVKEVFDNALKGQGTSNHELEFRTKSNEIRYLLVNATTRRDAENNIVGVMLQDVTEAKVIMRSPEFSTSSANFALLANAPIFWYRQVRSGK